MNQATTPAMHTAVSVLDRWARAFNEAAPERVADCFEPGALFQGLQPACLVGRDAIAAYYRAVPVGTRTTAQVTHALALGEHAVTAFATLRFDMADGSSVSVRLSLTLLRDSLARPGWVIAQWHAARVS